MTKQLAIILLLLFSFSCLFSQNGTKSELRVGSQNVFIKIDGSGTWAKFESDNNPATPNPALGNENVAYSSTSNGIFITILSGTNKIKLFALTGQLLLNGDLAQGRFFIPTRQGIYFLRINTKSYKVICR